MIKTGISGILRDIKRDRALHLFMLLPLVYIIIFNYVPMFGVQIALKDFTAASGILGSPWVGFKHFSKFFNSYQFVNVVTNTLRISLYSLAVGFPLPILFALALNTFPNQRLKKTIQSITYIPHFISVVVIVGLLFRLVNPINGMYGNIYRFLTNGIYPMDLLTKPKTFIHLYVWSGVWQDLGWSSIIYIAALAGVDPALSEAAQIDGATRWQRLCHIDFPSILPTASILLIMRAGSIMSVGFEKIYLMQNNLNTMYSEVISTYVYKVGMTVGANNYSYASAIGLFNSVINCILLVAVNALSGKLSDETSSLW